MGLATLKKAKLNFAVEFLSFDPNDHTEVILNFGV